MNPESHVHIWPGGRCPVPPETIVRVVRYRAPPDIGPARQYDWRAKGRNPGTVIAYNVVEDEE